MIKTEKLGHGQGSETRKRTCIVIHKLLQNKRKLDCISEISVLYLAKYFTV
jgi:hypothetical protein